MTVARATRRPSSSQSSALGMTLGSPALIACSATPVLDSLVTEARCYSIDLKRENAARIVFEEALGRVPTPLHGIAAGWFAAKVNLNTIREVKQPRSAEEIVKWSSGYAWLAGGTWLFSTPQIATDTPDRPPFAAVARACRVQ